MYREISSNKRRTVVFMGGFLLFVIALGWVFSRALGNPAILYIAVIFSTVQAFVSYYYSDKITLAISGAQEIQKTDSPELYRIVENLSITAGLPMPKVYVIDDNSPNAFATGRDPEHAVVCVTTGIMRKLEKAELEGVIAHELSHVGNYDIRLMTVVVVLVGIVVLMSDFFIRISFFGRGDDDNRDQGQLRLILMVVGIVMALLSPLFATMIQLAISRKREFLADANGALLTRFPEGLARALEKISSDPTPLKKANKATAHLFITNPLKGHKGARTWFSGLFDTHPPIEERVAKLRNMI